MVGRAPHAIAGVLALLAAPCGAAEADWTAAGGSLFVGEGSSTISPELPRPSQAPPGQPFAAAVEAAAAQHGLDPKLLHALVVVESAYRPDAVSSAGAGGLTQLMPATARSLGVVDRFDPDANLVAGAQYLSAQIERFRDLRLALAAYNAGPQRVARLGRIPAIPETQRYVEAVITCFLALSAGRTITSAKACVTARKAHD